MEILQGLLDNLTALLAAHPPGPEQDGGHLSELSQHLPAACRPLPGRR